MTLTATWDAVSSPDTEEGIKSYARASMERDSTWSAR